MKQFCISLRHFLLCQRGAPGPGVCRWRGTGRLEPSAGGGGSCVAGCCRNIDAPGVCRAEDPVEMAEVPAEEPANPGGGSVVAAAWGGPRGRL